MKAVVFLGEGKLELRDYPRPVPGPDEVIIRMKASGMCGTDLHHLHEPHRPESKVVIEGHEPCGVVEEVGMAVLPNQAAVGDRVMVHHYDGCRQCEYCWSGWTQFCEHGGVTYGGNGHGGHADFIKVPAHTIIKLPDEVSFKAGAAIACGAGTAYGALKRADVVATDTVAIFGQGPVGLAATLFAKAFGARVIALDVSKERLQMARDFGADFVVNPAEEDAVARIRALTPNTNGADKSIECSSSPAARRQAIQAVRIWGTACLVGVIGPLESDANEIIIKQKSVLGARTFSKAMQHECAQFVAERGIDLDRLFTHEFRIADAEEAYRLFDERKIGKGVFVFD